MKTYKLKKWYPSLPKWVEIGAIARYIEMYECYFISNYTIQVSEVENNPDFWELIEEEKPLFITKDGVECFDGDEYISIGDDFCMRSMRASNCDSPYSNDVVRFKNESNADEYIWQNKKLFSYDDMMTAKNSVLLKSEDIERSAKERSKL